MLTTFSVSVLKVQNARYLDTSLANYYKYIFQLAKWILFKCVLLTLSDNNVA